MNYDDWIQAFAKRDLLVTTVLSSTVSIDVDLLLVDGVAAIDQAIGVANSPQKLATILCGDVDSVAAETHAPEVCVHFDQTLALPFAHDARWDTALGENMRAFLSVHGTPETRRRLGACLHGDARTTEWPRPILKEPAARLALWRHPVFEWQLVHAISNELMTWVHYPTTLRQVTAIGVPVVPQLDKWDDTWRRRLQTVGRIYGDTLDKVSRASGQAVMEQTKDLLTMLHIGYGSTGSRQWTNDLGELPPSSCNHAVAADVYQQMANILYARLERRGEAEGPPLTVLVTKARDEALPALLLVLHRAHESGHALRIVVQWVNGRESVDLGATYARLRQHLSAQRSFTVPDLYVAMMMQNARGIGARARETGADLVWEALHEAHWAAGKVLSNFRENPGDAFTSRDTRLISWADQDRPLWYHWCVAHVDSRNMAEVALAVSAHCLVAAAEDNGSRCLKRDRRESDAYIHLLYRKKRAMLPVSWQVAPPLAPMEALARARRAIWTLEYACAASQAANRQSTARTESFACSKGTSVWGFQWVDDRSLLEENRLVDALFSSDLRLRSSTINNVLRPLDFGYFRLTNEVVL